MSDESRRVIQPPNPFSNLPACESTEAREGTCSSGGAPGTGVSFTYVALDLYQEASWAGTRKSKVHIARVLS